MSTKIILRKTRPYPGADVYYTTDSGFQVEKSPLVEGYEVTAVTPSAKQLAITKGHSLSRGKQLCIVNTIAEARDILSRLVEVAA